MANGLLERFSLLFKKQDATDAGVPAAYRAYNQSRPQSHRRSFCYAPSVNMLFSQDGWVKACCHNQEFTLGNYPKQSIREIWEGSEANRLRTYMQQYDLSHGCNICGADAMMGDVAEAPALHFDRLPQNKDYPSMMEFLFSNTCNLECVMCKGEFSSLIRKNREKLPPLDSPYNKQFLEQLEEFIPHLNETRFSGSGEAFSIDLNYELWEMIIGRNPQCVIMVQTNGTYLNARIKDLLSRGNFKIGVSLDSLNKEIYEGIRLNANFDRVMENINYFNDYTRSRDKNLLIATCVMRQNWRELPDFINYCNKLDAIALFHQVHNPKYYALDTLPQDELREIHKHLSTFDFPANTTLQKRNRQHYKYFLALIKQWADAPRAVEKEALQVNLLPVNELLPYLHNKIKHYLAEVNALDADRLIRFQKFDEKFNEFLGMYADAATKELLLRQACCVPGEVMILSFEKYPVKYLFEEGSNLLKV